MFDSCSSVVVVLIGREMLLACCLEESAGCALRCYCSKGDLSYSHNTECEIVEQNLLPVVCLADVLCYQQHVTLLGSCKPQLLL